jgi:hypothetical protein
MLLPEAPNPGRQVADVNEREIRRRFIQIAEGLEAAQPKHLADGLVEGAYAISQTMSGRKVRPRDRVGRRGPGRRPMRRRAKALLTATEFGEPADFANARPMIESARFNLSAFPIGDNDIAASSKARSVLQLVRSARLRREKAV